MTAPLVLSLRALGLGDLLAGVPALRAVQRAFPEADHVLAAPAWLAPLALHTGAIDAVLDARPLAPVVLPSDRRVQVAVNLHGRGPQSHRVLEALEPGRLVAFACGDVPGPEWRAEEHEVARWCRMLRESGISADETDLDVEPPDRLVPAHAAGATLLHPFPSAPARMWPVERWAALARAEAAHGHEVVITGTRAQRPAALDIARRAGLGDAAVLAGELDLLDLAAVVGAAGRVVAIDTGVAHLATALRRPSVVLFGPVPPSAWGPPADRPWHRSLWAGRRGDPWASTPDAGLLALTVEQVLATLADLPDAPASSLAADDADILVTPASS